jgi:hypothetical protein
VAEVYAKTLEISNFKVFGKARLKLQYPGRRGTGLPKLRNVNLILGDNGGGKSSVLRALAIAVLAPALMATGFVAYRLVRRSRPGLKQPELATVSVTGSLGKGELAQAAANSAKSDAIELGARIRLRGNGSLDKLMPDILGSSPLSGLLDDESSAAFFVAGYGATRRVETGDYSPSSALKSRGPRYQRIASLFEDHLALRPLHAWLPRLQGRAPQLHDQVVALINAVLPRNIRFIGQMTTPDDQYLFDFDGNPTPFNALSDGYKAFVGWVSDLLGQIADVASPDGRLADLPGIVLVDEIDLHLHPAWQREVVPRLAAAFPSLQFVFTSHSPLVASTVERENVFVTDTASDGTATIKQLEEKVFGRSTEQLLLSSYFGLETTRPAAFQDQARTLFREAAEGNSDAALSYLKMLTGSAVHTSDGDAS